MTLNFCRGNLPRNLPERRLHYVYMQKIAYKMTLQFLLKFRPEFIPKKKYLQAIQERIATGRNHVIVDKFKYIQTINEVLLIHAHNKIQKENKIMRFSNATITINEIDNSNKKVSMGKCTVNGMEFNFRAFGDAIKSLKKIDESDDITANAHVQVSEYEGKYYINLIIDSVEK